jgi:hypothetical protein
MLNKSYILNEIMLAVFVLAFVFKRNEIEMELISVKYVV